MGRTKVRDRIASVYGEAWAFLPTDGERPIPVPQPMLASVRSIRAQTFQPNACAIRLAHASKRRACATTSRTGEAGWTARTRPYFATTRDAARQPTSSHPQETRETQPNTTSPDGPAVAHDAAPASARVTPRTFTRASPVRRRVLAGRGARITAARSILSAILGSAPVDAALGAGVQSGAAAARAVLVGPRVPGTGGGTRFDRNARVYGDESSRTRLLGDRAARAGAKRRVGGEHGAGAGQIVPGVHRGAAAGGRRVVVG